MIYKIKNLGTIFEEAFSNILYDKACIKATKKQMKKWQKK